MAITDRQTDSLNLEEETKKLPDMLNVLTILTFIGSGLGLITSVWSYVKAPKTYEDTIAAQNQMENAPDFVKKLAGPNMVEMARKSLDNRMPILLLGLIGVALCIYGAIQMRALRKTGFTLYFIGEVLPVITAFIFIGFGLFSTFSLGITIAFPLVFIILYATQLKHLH